MLRRGFWILYRENIILRRRELAAEEEICRLTNIMFRFDF